MKMISSMEEFQEGLHVNLAVVLSSGAKVYKLAQEVKCFVSFMTAGYDLHNIQPLHIFPSSSFNRTVPQSITSYIVILLYVTGIKGLSAAIYCDQQGVDGFLDILADFWTRYQLPHTHSQNTLIS
jgi:hypothetical protein